MKEENQIEDEWSYEEDFFIMEKMKLNNWYYKWTKIARHVNKVFHNSEIVKTDKQIKRRWLFVLNPLVNNQWKRDQALAFVKISQKHQHLSRRYWQKLKKEFQPYTFKMLKFKYRQYQAMKEAQFLLSHATNAKQRVTNSENIDPTSLLCKHLEIFT